MLPPHCNLAEDDVPLVKALARLVVHWQKRTMAVVVASVVVVVVEQNYMEFPLVAVVVP